ncbi:MAG: 2-isopropylmalate synthase 2 (alpha-isopropylmalatesynthase 2) (alpha-ipm synthetase 2) protein [Burkholderiaceae bacterium]|nr:2-isopropylmalate synthase 2 (alpha-isopropylmalatesynthase 2) (alpha-ipm synthetase 2) protein [Burkholderiaceae bacterium]
MMLKDPSKKYRPFRGVSLPDRTWPDKVLTKAPVFVSSDLRDGNQALLEPMDGERKMRMFKMLVGIGLKEIEVAYPSASQTDFDFVRSLIEGGHIPADVTIACLAPARHELIERTVDSLGGTKRAIIHLYNASSPPFLDIVYGMKEEQVIDMACEAVKFCKASTARYPQTEWVLQYSLETFSGSDMDFAKRLCDAVVETWGGTPENKVILNLPATIEMASPNVYADQIEWIGRNLAKRDSVIISLHPHNDRGCAVAAAELGLLAGAERVEGCLFGNGERTGNVDLITVAMNMYTAGISPGLDFSDMNEVARTAEYCTQMPINPRHPYVGDFVFTAFSGTHQDAIKKGLAKQDGELWNVPYLPFDPTDIGRTYDSVIRVNSQSGKGGVAFILEANYGIVMPRRMQIEFSRIVQEWTDGHGGEATGETLWNLFQQTYLTPHPTIAYQSYRVFDQDDAQGVRLNVVVDGAERQLSGVGNGPIDAAVAAFGLPLRVQSFEEHAMGKGADAKAVAYVEVMLNGLEGSFYGVGIHANILTASILAVFSGLNHAIASADDAKRRYLLDMFGKASGQAV